MSRPTIAVLSDFGREDTYVGLMKCVMSDICPGCRFIDLSHEIPPQNILSGAYLSASSAPYLPEGAVLLAVVDPGVGSGRRAIAAESDGLRVVGPDNGLFSLLFERREPQRIVALENTQRFLDEVSTTFHGRDIFAPAAAHVAAGVALDDLGPRVDPADLSRLPASDVHSREEHVAGQVIHIDRFGNLITNIRQTEIEAWRDGTEAAVEICGVQVALRETFTDVPQGEPIAYIGSTDHLEVAVNRGDASRYLGASQGTDVFVRAEGEISRSDRVQRSRR